jgi:hypothetical protein
MSDENPMGQVIQSMKPGSETILARWFVGRWKRR